MKRKKKILAGVVTGLLMSAGVGYAHIIPGVDRPFDPFSYYSPTAISYPDSAPSAFALKDLSRGNVYDYARHLKNILIGDKFVAIENNVMSQLMNRIINMTGMDEKTAQVTTKAINDILQHNEDIALADVLESADKQGIFRTLYSNKDPANWGLYNETRQLDTLQQIYQKSLENLQKSQSDSKARMETVNQVLDNSANAKGDVEALQASSQMEAIQEAETMRRNTLLSNMATVEAAHQRWETDRNLNAAQATKEGFAFRSISRNNDETKNIQGAAKKEEPLGFLDF